MGSRSTGEGVEKVYEAAQRWVDCALKADGSLFTPGDAIWTSERLKELRERFLDRPDEWRGPNFFGKLEVLLEDSAPEVHQLMGEVLYVSYLIVWRGAIGGTRKRERISQVLGWSRTSVTIPDDCVDGLTPGIAHPGAFFIANFPLHPGYIIELVEQWKEQQPDERLLDHKDPDAAWEFKKFVMGVDWRGVLQSSYPNSPTAQQEALLHLVYPDTFEGILSVDHKNRIAATFVHLVTEQTEDVDRKLVQIRRGLEAELGRDFDFYQDDIYSRWKSSTTDPWDDFVRRAQKYYDTGKLDSEEVDYKLEIGRKLAAVGEEVLSNVPRADGWRTLLKDALKGENNLINWRNKAVFLEVLDEYSDGMREALRSLWTPADQHLELRFHQTTSILMGRIPSTAARTNITSVLLMGLNAEEYPPFQKSLFDWAYERTGYPRPKQGPSETGLRQQVGLYEHALGFLDKFIEEASERRLPVRHRLDAQSLVWAVWNSRDETTEAEVASQTEPDLQALADKLHLPVEFLQEIETLLDDKKQVIFQGPPGTGKTYVAQKLAKHLAGSEERVTLVQLHPSYAYEDFVQGFRPALVGNGQPGFELRNGPLLRAANRAKGEPDEDHFLVIDEINRGNLAKVLGELYFLLEYRDESIRLQYSDEPFSLPGNLYIIGTMNTADRSIALVDLALRRRFYFVEFHPDEEPVKGVLRRWLQQKAPGMEWVADVVERANEKLREDRHAAIGPSYFMKDDLDEEAVTRIWKHSVLPYIEERLFGEGDRLGEFDLDTLRREADRGGVQDQGEMEEGSDADDGGGVQ